MMGYEALGNARIEWLSGVRRMFEVSAQQDHQVASLLPIGTLTHALLVNMNTSMAVDWAATVQAAFTALVIDLIRDELHGAHGHDGIAMVGGCALNIKLNSDVRTLLHVYVPAAPNDAGLGVGAAWTARPPLATSARPSAFCGPALFDGPDLDRAAKAARATAASMEEVVRMLSAGDALGVVRGRTEWGPRALGHRSLLMFPADPSTQQLLNRIKQRQPWRPVAPMLTIEALDRFVDGTTDGNKQTNFAFMSFALPLSAAARAALPGIVHADGSARLQTVTRSDDPWLHRLLEQVGEPRGRVSVATWCTLHSVVRCSRTGHRWVISAAGRSWQTHLSTGEANPSSTRSRLC
jgi:carbamoyltransferase